MCVGGCVWVGVGVCVWVGVCVCVWVGVCGCVCVCLFKAVNCILRTRMIIVYLLRFDFEVCLKSNTYLHV